MTVIAPRIESQLTRWVMEGKIDYVSRQFKAADLVGKRLVIAATDDSDTNRHVYEVAENIGVLANVTDDPDICRFIVPAIIDRSPITIAISSAGNAPVLARLLRQKLATLIPAAYGRLAAFAGGLRGRVKSSLDSLSTRRRFWESVLEGPIAEKILNGQEQTALELFDAQLAQHVIEAPGKTSVVLQCDRRLVRKGVGLDVIAPTNFCLIDTHVPGCNVD